MSAFIHHCHFPGCKTATPRKWLYCKPHWFMVPAAIRRRVWAAYNALPHGPEGNCLEISDEWLAATKGAEEAIRVMARPKTERPFGWEVDVAILEGMVKRGKPRTDMDGLGKESVRGKRTFHYRGCPRSAAKTKALLRRVDQSGRPIAVTRVLDVRAVNEEEWIRAYGIGRM